MHSQLYLTGRLAAAPETSETAKGKLWVKLLLETQLIRETGRGEFQTESVLLPIKCFSQEAEAVRALHKGDALTIGAHVYPTQFQPDGGGIKYGVQIVCDQVLVGGSQR